VAVIVSDRPDWSARARREAAAILSEAVSAHGATAGEYRILINLVALGWLQGVNYGAHEALGLAEDAFSRLKADLA
jgi:hypothetical protein